jgi:nitrite reductase/ring-hydroxylating ferredoxin subunit
MIYVTASQDVEGDMTQTLTDDVQAIRRAVGSSVGTITEARTLPAESYTSPAFYEFEKDAVFGRSWLFVCHVSQLPKPGDFHAVTVVDEPMIIARQPSGDITALSAVCQHRGFVLAEEDGSASTLRCPYHYWTYDLSGKLVSAPSMRPDHSLDDLRTDICLPRFAVEVWNGLVFVNLDPDAAPLAPTVTSFDAAIAAYRLADMVVADLLTFPDLPFNWKNMQENALEEYHTSYIHKGLHDNAPAHLVEHGSYTSGENAMYRYAGMVVKGGERVEGQPFYPVIEGLPERERGYMVFGAVPPTLFVALTPTGAKLYRIIPHAADRMTLTILLMLPPSTLELDNIEELKAGSRRRIDLVDVPDIETSVRMYKGLRSRHAPRGPFSHQERTLPQFNQWLLDQYASWAPRGGTPAP